MAYPGRINSLLQYMNGVRFSPPATDGGLDLYCIVSTRPPEHKHKRLRQRIAFFVPRNRRMVNGLTRSTELIDLNRTEITVGDRFMRRMQDCHCTAVRQDCRTTQRQDVW